jgi:predicted DCC family thiol-disulfide oxidoreductase YuxK
MAITVEQREPMGAETAEPARVVLFDGVCHLCNRTVDFLIRHDRRRRLRFASLQSETGNRLLEARARGRADEEREAGRAGGAGRAGAGSPGPRTYQTVVFVDGDRVHERSSGALRIVGALGWPWRLAMGFLLVPRPLRDLAYDWVARNRYRWFGQRRTCRLPGPEERGRFLA